MLAWYLLEVALNALVNYSSCTYDDWYYLYFLVPHSLALYLEIHILIHLLSGFLLDVVVTWDRPHQLSHIFRVFLLYYHIWLITWDASVLTCVVLQDGWFLIPHHLFLDCIDTNVVHPP